MEKMNKAKRGESGAALVEYVLLACLISLTAMTSVSELGVKMSEKLTVSADAIGGGTILND